MPQHVGEEAPGQSGPVTGGPNDPPRALAGEAPAAGVRKSADSRGFAVRVPYPAPASSGRPVVR